MLALAGLEFAVDALDEDAAFGPGVTIPMPPYAARWLVTASGNRRVVDGTAGNSDNSTRD